MKHFKKMMALIIALVMVVGTLSMAFADDTIAYDETVTVKDLTEGDVVHFYKIVEWADNATGNVKGWKAVSPFDSVLTTAKLTEILVGDPDATPAVAPTGITSAIAGQLAKLATGTGITKTVASGETTVSLTVTDDHLTEGIYMGLITPSDPDTVYNPVFVSADYNKDKAGEISVSATYAPEATVKKSTSELKKEAKTSEEVYEDGKWTTTAIGDTVSYTVTTTIPGYGNVYQNPHFVMRDKLTDLKLVEGTVKITEPSNLAATSYDIDEAADGLSYTITFSPEYLKTVLVPTKITVTYDAIVTTTAPVHVNTEKNEISTEFSHIPTSESDYAFKKDTTQHYTVTIDANGLGSDSTQSGKKTSELVKQALGADGKVINEIRTSSEISPRNYVQSPLEGAEFKLYVDNNGAPGAEYIPKSTDGTAMSPFELKSDKDGRITIAGLDAGTYWLQETKAPAGYVKQSDPVKIQVVIDTEEKEVTEYTTDGENWISQEDYDKLSDAEKATYKSYKFSTPIMTGSHVFINDKETATYNYTNKGTDADIVWSETGPVEIPSSIVNTQGVELPNTGGIGTTIFYVIGAILVVGAGVLLVTRRRMTEE